MRGKKAGQTGSHDGRIHSRDGALFGHGGPGQKGQLLLSTRRPPCVLVWLSLPDEGVSEGG